MAARICIVDDEAGVRLSLRGILEDEGYAVAEAESAEQGLALLQDEPADLVFLDIWLPGMDGLKALEAIGEQLPGLPVVMISGHGNIETAVDAIKHGAFDFIEKPLSLEKVVITAEKALEFSRLRQENIILRSKLPQSQATDLTGSSGLIRRLREDIQRVAPTDAWVLITGENGTGKEIIARSVHLQSRRKDRPMVAVNCAAIPEELIESELFGHEKGSFTGAGASTPGKFEMAHKGTLFLDEIGDMSLKTQAKILRILQEQSFERLGSRKTIKVDVRVIAATNKNLEAEIDAGSFRQDLYYRLRVIPLHAPPLRERPEDLPELIAEFTNMFCKENGARPVEFEPDAMKQLARYPWPGNVRELKNFVERMHIMHPGVVASEDMLPSEYRSAAASPKPQSLSSPSYGGLDFKTARSEFERAYLESKLQEYKGNVANLAEVVGLERSYLYRKLKAYGILTSE